MIKLKSSDKINMCKLFQKSVIEVLIWTNVQLLQMKLACDLHVHDLAYSCIRFPQARDMIKRYTVVSTMV